ncbi:hypothetical protein ACVWXQ_004478 [Bradyrhizobium sp. S3.14.4]
MVQLAIFIRMRGECQKGVPDAVDGGVDPGGEERPHQVRCFVLGDLAVVGRLIDHHAEPVWLQCVPGAAFHDPALCGEARLARCGQHFVLRAKAVEHEGAPGQQLLAAVRPDADRIRKHFHGIGLRKIGYGIEGAFVDQFRDLPLRLLLKRLAQLPCDARRQRAAENPPALVVIGRVDLKRQRLWQRGIHPVKADTLAADEGLPVLQGGLDFGIACHGPHAIPLQRERRPERAQRFIGGIGIHQEVRRERVDRTGCNAAHGQLPAVIVWSADTCLRSPRGMRPRP